MSIIEEWLYKHKMVVKTQPINIDGSLKWGFIIYFLDQPVGSTEIFKSYQSLYEDPIHFETEILAFDAGSRKALNIIKKYH